MRGLFSATHSKLSQREIHRRSALRKGVYLAIIGYLLSGCQSSVLQSLKTPGNHPQANHEQIPQKSLIQKAFADAGIILQPPNLVQRPQLYKCKTQYVSMTFTSEEAGLALDLASVADAIYQTMKTWFGFGLPTRAEVSLRSLSVRGLAGDSEILMLRGHCDMNLPLPVKVPLYAVSDENRFIFAHKLGHQFVNKRIRGVETVPVWFYEGILGYLATAERAKPSFAEQVMWNLGLTKELQRLDDLPAPSSRRSQSYRSGLSFILFLHHEYGEQTLRSLVRQVINAPRVPLEISISSVYGKTQSNLEGEWNTNVQKIIQPTSESVSPSN